MDVGDTLTYRVTVTNDGPSLATGVLLTDKLPAGVALQSATPSQGHCDRTLATVTCELGAIVSGANATVTIIVTPSSNAAGTTITNTASVTAVETDPKSANNSASRDTAVAPEADLSVTKAGSPDSVTVGAAITYTLTVINGGPSDATGVTLTDRLPAGVTLVSSSTNRGSCTGTSTVICTIGSLRQGDNAVVTITVTPGSAGALTNTASVEGNERDPREGNNIATETTTVTPLADLALAKAAAPDSVVVRDELTYNGPSTATGVTLTDTLPAGVNLVSSTSGQGRCSGTSTVICALGTLGRGDSVTVTIVVNPTAPGEIVNVARVTSGVAEPDTSDNTASATTMVEEVPAAPPPRLPLSLRLPRPPYGSHV